MDISPTMIMLISFFSLLWFILGILTGRYLPKMRQLRPSDGPKRRGGDRLVEIYVGNLPYETTEKDMEKTFKTYGAVASSRIITNRFNGKSRGFGFIEMEDRSEAETAIRALNGKDLGGRRIVVNEAK